MEGSAPGRILGLHHVKVPVTDLVRSRAWYERVFGLEPILEWPDADGVVRGVRYAAQGGFALALRENAELARAMAGFDPIVILVERHQDVEAWAKRLDELEVAHSPVVAGAVGWMLSFTDPDGLQLKLYSEEPHRLPPDELQSRARPASTP